ncbi:MAG: class I SAM-dependent methyltransferase [Opitutaceae bacterium]|jgi:ubiquinone/menaquinone biosynthesis C-methylase UbiE
MCERRLTAVQQLERCNTLSDLAAAFGIDQVSPFESPVVARLYDALLCYERASMIRGVVDDFYAAIGTPVAGSSFLEVGCGSGRVLIEMANRILQPDCSFVGVDPSSEMIAIAEENLAKHSVPANVRFFTGSMLDASAVEEIRAVDFVIVRNTISWMSNADASIRAALQCLKPGGKVLIRELRRDAYFPLLKTRIRNCLAFQAGGITLAYPPSAMVAAYRSAMTLAEILALLGRCGVSVNTVRPNENDNAITEPWGVEMFLTGVKKL